jgi:hypothetical protein
MSLSYKQLGSTFISTPSVTIYSSGTQYAISASATGSGTIISGTNVGTGLDFFTGLSTTINPNDTLALRNLLAGPNISISPSVTNDGDTIISRGVNVVNQILNIGNGASVLSTITATNLLVAITVPATNNGITSSNPASPSILLLRPTNATASKAFINDASGVLTINTSYHTDTTGGLGIGQVSTNTSRILPGAGSTTQSNIRFTPFSAPYTGLTDGDIWYTSSNDLKFNKGVGATTDFIFKNNNSSLTGLSNSILLVDTAGTLSTKYINSFGLFNTLSSVTITNTASETSIISPVLTGSTTLLASTNPYNPELGIGRKFRFNAKGTIDTGDFVILTIRLKLGSTVISSSSTIIIGGAYTSEIEIDVTFTIRNSGLLICSGKILFLTFPPSTLEGDPVIFGIYSQDATITTTSDQVFDCTTQFDVADPSNIITINESTLEILN